MKNYQLLIQNIEDGLNYIQKQQETTRPIIDYLIRYINKHLPEEQLSVKEALQYYQTLMEQETNSILVISKMQEVLSFIER